MINYRDRKHRERKKEYIRFWVKKKRAWGEIELVPLVKCDLGGHAMEHNSLDSEPWSKTEKHTPFKSLACCGKSVFF
jgi:hypothetical protein